MSNSSVQQPVTVETLLVRIEELERHIAQIETKTTKGQREMTDEDALNVLTGELSKLSHNKAAEALKLSYGQVYSCRLQYTFRHIHKQLDTKGFKNPWKK